MAESKFISLLVRRNKAFQQFTDQIFKEIDNVKEAAVEFLNVEANDVIWDTVEAVQGVTLITFRIIVRDMSTLIDEEENIISPFPLYEEDDTIYQQLTLSLPLDLVDKGTVTEIVEFLSEADQNNHLNQEMDMLSEIINSITDEVENLPEVSDDHWEDNPVYNKKTVH